MLCFQPVPKELTPLLKQLEEMKLVVAQEAKKKKPSNSIYNAKSYITLMTQVFLLCCYSRGEKRRQFIKTFSAPPKHHFFSLYSTGEAHLNGLAHLGSFHHLPPSYIF